jgi:hypothetical protein
VARNQWRGSHRIERRAHCGGEDSIGEGCRSAAADLWAIGITSGSSL